MKWLPGAPPDAYGLFLVQLDAAVLRKRFAIGLGYDGDPVCVRWVGDRGRDTMRGTRIDGDLVVSHVAIREAK